MDFKKRYAFVSKLVKKHTIQNLRQNAYRKINEELVTMYFEIGKYLTEKVIMGEYGDGTILKISAKIKKQYSTLNRFSKRGCIR